MKIKEFELKGYNVTIEYDEFPSNPRGYNQKSIFYGVDENYPLSLLEDKNGRIVLNKCEQLRGKWYSVVSKYEHGGIALHLGLPSDRWDSSVIGVIAIPKTFYKRKEADKVFAIEVEKYEHYLNGEVYAYSIKDKHGDIVDSCCDYYDVDQAESDARCEVEAYAHSDEYEAIEFWSKNND